MDAAEALLQAVRIPGQVVVDHQVGVLQVHAFAGGVGGDQHPCGRVVAEQLLHLAPLFALHPAVDHDHGFLAADQAPDLVGQVVQRVAVLGKDDQLTLAPHGVLHLGCVLQQARQLVPLAVLARVHDLAGLLFQGFEDDDFGLEFLDGLCGRGLVNDGLFEVLVVVGRQRLGRLPNVIGGADHDCADECLGQ